MTLRALSVIALCAVLFENCFATPAVALLANKRVERSPQFGFPGNVPEYQQYPIGGGLPALPGAFGVPAPAPILPGAYPEVLPSQGAYPSVGVFPERQTAGAAFASANTGLSNLGGLPSVEQNQASSQSASFNLGPLSASFSNADASSDKEIF